MNIRRIGTPAALALYALAAAGAYAGGSAPPPNASGAGAINESKLAQIRPGKSTKNQVQSLLGTPWRIVQFNDCGEGMPGQADETWDYRGKDSHGTYRVHIEFDDAGIAHLLAKIPDNVQGGKGTTAKIAAESTATMKM